MSDFHMTFMASYWTYDRPWRVWCTCGWSETWKTKRTAKKHVDKHLSDNPNDSAGALYKLLAGEDEDGVPQPDV